MYIDRRGNTIIYAGINTLIRRFYACSYDVIFFTYLGRIYRTCTVGNSGAIAQNIV